MFFRIILIIVLSLTSFSGIFAAGGQEGCTNTGDITQSNFKLNLGCMDPLNEGDGIKEKRDKDGKVIQKSQGGITVLTTLLGSLTDLFLFIIPIIAAISFLAAGYFYIFSAGDSEKVGKAKTIIKWNMVAITMALLSYGIIKFIAELFT